MHDITNHLDRGAVHSLYKYFIRGLDSGVNHEFDFKVLRPILPHQSKVEIHDYMFSRLPMLIINHILLHIIEGTSLICDLQSNLEPNEKLIDSILINSSEGEEEEYKRSAIKEIQHVRYVKIFNKITNDQYMLKKLIIYDSKLM